MTLPPGRHTSGNEYVFEACPRCGRKDKFWWNTQKEKGICYAAACGVSASSLEGLRYLLGGGGDSSYGLPSLDKIIPKPTPQWRVPVDLAPIGGCLFGRKYLRDRRWSESAAFLFNITSSLCDGVVWVPLTPLVEGLPPAFMVRHTRGKYRWLFTSPDPDAPKSSYVLSSPLVARGSCRRVLLVEGPGDLFRHPSLAPHGVALCGSKIPMALGGWLRSKGVQHTVLWPDNDPSGRALISEARKDLKHGWKLGFQVAPPYTASDPGDADPVPKELWFDKL